MTIRERIRIWLGIDEEQSIRDQRLAHALSAIASQQEQIEKVRSELYEFKSALARISGRRAPLMPVYADYETSQVVALKQFEENK
jgi:hypothetical protein